MLPSSKRPPARFPSFERADPADEVIGTGDYEVVHVEKTTYRGASRYPSPPSSRPLVFEPHVSDDDRTMLFAASKRTPALLPPRTPSFSDIPTMPRSARLVSSRPPRREVARNEVTNLRASVRPRVDTEDRTVLRPSAAPPEPPRASVRPSVAIAQPAQVAHAGQPAAPSVAPVAMAKSPRDSQPGVDPPSAVITAHTRALSVGRPNVTWAVAVMALGVFVGLVTAVVVRGDADTVIDATASFVEPPRGGGAHVSGASMQAAVIPSFVASGKAAPQGTDANPAPAACGAPDTMTVTAPIVVNAPAPRAASNATPDPSAASRPTPPKAAPVAYAAPRRSSPKAASASAGGALANITPPGAGAPIARPSKAARSGGSDFDAAARADELAKMQLEASLR